MLKFLLDKYLLSVQTHNGKLCPLSHLLLLKRGAVGQCRSPKVRWEFGIWVLPEVV